MGRPRPRPSSRPRDAQQWIALVYGVATATPPVLMLAHIVVSFALAGGQVLPHTRRLWREVVRYPVFVIPDWVILGLAGIALILVVPLVATTTARRAGTLVAVSRSTFGMLVADGLLAFAFPSRGGLIPVPDPDEPGQTLGTHWLGVPVAAICSVVLFVRILQTNAEHTRLTRSSELDEV